jgi:hypothetical protein
MTTMNHELIITYRPTGFERSVVVATLEDAHGVLEAFREGVPQSVADLVSHRIELTNAPICRF